MTKPFRGLTWDHPRGYNALAAAAERARAAGEVHVEWDKQPLEGFESHPIADLAARYDLLVLDHPHIGEAVAENCLRPLEDFFGPDEIAGWRAQTVGQAMASYRWAGQHWALPLDVATQVMAYRGDLIGTAKPGDWEGVVRLSEVQPVALSVAGPHAILNLFSICVSLESEPGGEDLVRDDITAEALGLMRRIARRAPSESSRLNPIGLLESLTLGDGLALVPLVYGYVTYATPEEGRYAVTFADTPTAGGRAIHGSVLGGTGIAITRRAEPDDALLDHLRFLMSPAAQSGFIPDHDGQPSARTAWSSATVNGKACGFYAATLKTTEQAFVRPRYDGYIAFQTEASAIVRRALFDGLSDAETIVALRRAWRASRAKARGPLE